MNPSSISGNSPSLSPIGDPSKIQIIDYGLTCGCCGASVIALQSVFGIFYQSCHVCGQQDSNELEVWYLIDKRNGRRASPEYFHIGQALEYAALFGIQPKDDYRVCKGVYFYDAEQQQDSRSEHLSLIKKNVSKLDWLFQVHNSNPGSEGLVQLAIEAELTGYALPQFRHTAKGA
jgi:hypothetical protein